MTTAPAIEAADLSKRFGTFVAVDRVTFRVAPGEVFGFLGPNGSGKSTTIRMLCGILLPTSGTGRVAGFDVAREAERVRQNIGYMSQRFSLYAELTVRENLDFFAGIYGIPSSQLAVRRGRILSLVGLDDARDVAARDLPGGLRQRLALACAVIHDPPVLFLDEPTAGVDPISRRDFWRLIRTMAAAGTAILVTTHYMDEAEHCRSLAFMFQGRLIAQGTPAALKADLQGCLAEVRVAPEMLVPALQALRGYPAAREVALFGAAIHVALRSPEALAPLRAHLHTGGVAPEEVRAVSPSLEDVFVSLATRGATP
jgi:ABC-2 type transport system ATP-binding protein